MRGFFGSFELAVGESGGGCLSGLLEVGRVRNVRGCWVKKADDFTDGELQIFLGGVELCTVALH